jgi:hypothetical protein
MKYTAYATMRVSLQYTFELPEGEDPWEYAQELDGGLFEEIPDTGDWDVYDVEAEEEREPTLVNSGGKIINYRFDTEEELE